MNYDVSFTKEEVEEETSTMDSSGTTDEEIPDYVQEQFNLSENYSDVVFGKKSSGSGENKGPNQSDNLSKNMEEPEKTSKEKVEKTEGGKSSTGLDENVAGALSYGLGWLTGILFFVIEKDSKFVKFHAMQSIITFLVIMMVSWIPIIGWLIGILSILLWLFLMIQAYQGKKYKLPVIGDFAEKQAENLK